MKNFTRTLSLFMCLIFIASTFFACGGEKKEEIASTSETEKETEKMSEKETEKITETEIETETEAKTEPEKKSIRILEIGNSFGWDAVANLYPVLKSMGYEDIYIKAVHYSACSIQQYAQFAKRDRAVFYEYTIDNDAPLQSKEGSVLKDIIESGEWDVITLMQNSADVGVEKKYTDGNLEYMINYVKEHSPNKDYKLFWHMGWPYTKTSTDANFAKLYEKDPIKMFNMMTENVKKYILTNDAFKGFIPNGTAIQSLRTSKTFEGKIERDNHHLSLVLGRYAASLTFACAITGKTVDDCAYFPTDSASGLNKNTVEIVRNTVKSALENPFKITECSK